MWLLRLKLRFDAEVDHLKELDEKQCDRWCYLDLKKRGAIS